MSNQIRVVIVDPTGLLPPTVGTEDAAAPAALIGQAVLGRANAAEQTPDEGDFAVLSFDLFGRLRTVAPAGSQLADSFTGADAVGASADIVAAVASLRFTGFSVQETAGAVARFNLLHGNGDDLGPRLFPVRLVANEGTSEIIPHGVLAPNGIRIEWVSGAFDLTVYHRVQA